MTQTPDKSYPGLFWIILLAGLALRVAWGYSVEVDPLSDSRAYHAFASNLVTHGTYGWEPDNPGAYWPVGTSAIIAVLYTIFGISFTPVVVLNIVVSSAVIWQVFWLGRRYFDLRTGLIAAAFIAFWPSLIMYVSVLASEVFFIFLLLGGLIAFEARWKSVWIGALLAGLFWAGAAYVRPLALLVPLVFGASILLRGRLGLVQTLLCVGLVYVVVAAAIAPWSIRNTELFGHRVTISTNFGPVFWMGNNPETNGGYQKLPDWAAGLNEHERASRLKEEAFAYVAAEPVAFVQRTVVKFVRLHERETIAVAWNANQIKTGAGLLKALATGYWLTVLLAALWGCWQVMRLKGMCPLLIHPCFLGWMYITWVHAVIIMGDRYHIPAVPFVVILAAFGLRQLTQDKETGAVA